MDRLVDALPQLGSDLASLADRQKAASMAAYMKHHFEFFGVQTADRRRLGKSVMAAGKGRSTDDLLSFAETCWRQCEREFQYIATDLLRRWATVLGPDDLPRVEALIRAKSWWDTVDSLAAWTVGPMVANHPELVDIMDDWIDDDDLWIARTAILHQLSYKEACDADRLFAYVDRRAADTEFFIRKALGWALRQHARVDPEGVRRFVDSRGDSLSGLTRREAMKRIS